VQSEAAGQVIVVRRDRLVLLKKQLCTDWYEL
jgi:hypothetical protein